MRPLFAAAALIVSVAQAHAADPVGCDKFNWPIERERAALSVPDLPELATGAEMSAPPPIAVALASP